MKLDRAKEPLKVQAGFAGGYNANSSTQINADKTAFSHQLSAIGRGLARSKLAAESRPLNAIKNREPSCHMVCCLH